MKPKFKILLALLFVGAFSFSQQPSLTGQTTDYSHYLDQYVDPSVKPGDDFYHYAVGKWLKNNPIPSNERAWGIGDVVQEETYQRLQKINEEASASSAEKGSNAQKIGDFWFAAMDTDTIEKVGIAPLKAEFDRIAAIHDNKSLVDTIAHLQYIGVGALCSLAIFQDEMDSTKFALHLYQGGLGMPERSYYFDTDDRTKNIRNEYILHLEKMFSLMGDDEEKAKTNAETVMRMETDLARASRKLEDLRDTRKNYNKMSIEGMSRLTPSIQWKDFLAAGNIHDLKTVIVGQPEFFKQVEVSVKKNSLDDWKTYLRWQLINSYASQVSRPFDLENFHFYGTILNGTPEQRPRWKRMLDQEDGYLGDALGQLYVKEYFSPETKARYEKLTNEIFDAFRERIQKLDWMSDATKQKAQAKLNSVMKKVGYPDKWRDYSNYDVDRSSFVSNCMKGNMWLADFYIQKLYKPVDRTEWGMTPQTYNAYYNPSNNEIVLPAAAFILPGIPDSEVDDALVYSYAGGATIGHEITHGFDDQGRQFDDQGNLKDWWTKEDGQEFNKRAAGIVQQYNDYVVVDTLHANGSASQGENIADLGGITLGWDAFTKTEQYKNGKPIGGFTPAQRYFIGWALGWMNNQRPENLAVQVKTNVHAPSFLRVIGPVTNMPQFYEAFDVKPGDKMYRGDKAVRIW
jgi:putative endopeptidase